MKLIILAAGQGTRLMPLTTDRPKCMVELHGRPLIQWQIDVARSLGISDIVILTGYRAECLELAEVRYCNNPSYADTNMVFTLSCAIEELEGECIVTYGDIVFESSVLETVIAATQDIVVAIDVDWLSYWKLRMEDPLDDVETLVVGTDGALVSIGQPVTDISAVEGQYIGLLRFSDFGTRTIRDELMRMRAAASQGIDSAICGMYMTDFLQAMIRDGMAIFPAAIHRRWFEIDSPDDLKLAHRHSQVEDGHLKIAV